MGAFSVLLSRLERFLERRTGTEKQSLLRKGKVEISEMKGNGFFRGQIKSADWKAWEAEAILLDAPLDSGPASGSLSLPPPPLSPPPHFPLLFTFIHLCFKNSYTGTFKKQFRVLMSAAAEGELQIGLDLISW